MKILLVEDNRQLAVAIRDQLKPNYTVEIVSKAEAGIAKSKKNTYMIIVLDLHLPDSPGIKVCEAIRRRGDTTPILVLTGNGDMKARVALLNAGADDYLTKPFNIEELKARIAALSRRGGGKYNDDVIQVKDLTLNRTQREASRSGVVITLRKKEFDLLEFLIVNRGRAMSREMILANVWESGTALWNNTIDVHIKSLRDKVDKPFAIPIIKTAHGIGYLVEDEL